MAPPLYPDDGRGGAALAMTDPCRRSTKPAHECTSTQSASFYAFCERRRTRPRGSYQRIWSHIELVTTEFNPWWRRVSFEQLIPPWGSPRTSSGGRGFRRWRRAISTRLCSCAAVHGASCRRRTTASPLLPHSTAVVILCARVCASGIHDDYICVEGMATG